MTPNKQQKAAINSPAQFLKINAGAGTGKTQTLALRALRQSKKGNVCALTFTRKAAGELKERIGNIYSSTIGAFNFKIIMEHYSDAFGKPKPTVVTEYGAVKNVEYILDGMGLTYTNWISKQIYYYICKLKEGGITTTKMKKLNPDLRPLFYNSKLEKWANILKDVFINFNRFMYKDSSIILADLPLTAGACLKRRPREIFRSHPIDSLLIDEAQDLNMAQLIFFKRWFKYVNPKCNLTIVGDDRQAIYGFRGSITNLMKRFEQIFEDHD